MKVNKNFAFALLIAINSVTINNLLTIIKVSDIQLFCITLLLSLPLRIKGDIYSLFGGFNENGSVFSLFGIVQNARDKATSVAGLCIIQTGAEVVQMFSISIYQKGERVATHWVGLSLFQTAKEKSSFHFGISLFQRSELYAWQLISFSLFQKVEYGAIHQTAGISIIKIGHFFSSYNDQILGISIYQKGCDVSQTFGISIYQNAGGHIFQNGLSFIQKSYGENTQGIGVRFFVTASEIISDSILCLIIFSKKITTPHTRSV